MRLSLRTIPRGFTVVELLVSISIIILLAGILVPVISGVRSKAYESDAVSRMRSIHTAILLSKLDNDGFFPLMKNYAWDGPVDPAGNQVAENYPWVQQALAPYVESEQIDTTIQEIFRNPVILANENPAWLLAPENSHYRYNVMTAPGNYMTDDNKAVVLFDVAWPDWPAGDLPYQSGSGGYLYVVMGSGAISQLLYEDYLALHNGGNETKTSPFFSNGWAE